MIPDEINFEMTPNTTFSNIHAAIVEEVGNDPTEISNFLVPIARSAVDLVERPWVVEANITGAGWTPCFCGPVATEADAESMRADHEKRWLEDGGEGVEGWRVTNQIEKIRSEVGETRLSLLNDLATYYYDQQEVDA